MEPTNTESRRSSDELTAIIFEIRDHLFSSTLETSSTTAMASSTGVVPSVDITFITNIRSRLLDVATPQETMNRIIPYLFHQESVTTSSRAVTSGTLTAADALQILGFLVSSQIDVTKEDNSRPQYLIASSKVIKRELQKCLKTTKEGDSTLEPNSSHIMNELIHVLIHQACSGLDIEVSQNCHDSILLLFESSTVVATPILTGTLEEVISVWSHAIDTVTTNITSHATTKPKEQTRNEYGTICVRCTALIVDIILLNDNYTMQLLFDSTNTDSYPVQNLLHALLTDLSDDDPLLQISIYDILYKLASERPYHSMRSQLLIHNSFLQPLLRKAGVGGSENEPDLFLSGSSLRILIAICALLNDSSLKNNVDVVTIGDGLIRDLHAALRNFEVGGSSNEMERISYIDAISSLASTSVTAMNMVLNDPITSQGWLSLDVAQPKIKASILVSISNVLDRPDTAISDGFNTGGPSPLSSNEATNELCMQLYSSLGRVNGHTIGSNHSDTTELLLKLVQSPIPEIRLGVHRLFEAIAKYPTGGQILMTNPNFYTNYLMQRIETTYEGRVLKYNIVQALSKNVTLKQLLSNEIVTQLEQYISQGPHYHKAIQWDVMTEEQ